VNDFDAWNQAEVLVNHILATQPDLIFSVAPGAVGKAVGDSLAVAGEPLACAAATGVDQT
jgi:hypothetical protein